MTTIGTKQQNRSKRLRTVILDDQTQDIQGFVERNAGGDHLEETLFSSEQCSASLVPGDVYGGTDITAGLARYLAHGPDDPLHWLDRPAHTPDWKARCITGLF